MAQRRTPASHMLFERVALLTGRTVYWALDHSGALTHAQGTADLLKWCLQFPNARLGIDPRGIGLIVRSVLHRQGKSLSSDQDRWLDNVGAREDNSIPWESDAERFGGHLNQLVSYLEQSAHARTSYIWVSHEEAKDWASQTGQCLSEYTPHLFQSGTDRGDDLLSLFLRHRCVLFSEFDIDLLDAIRHRLNGLDPERRNRLGRMLAYHGITRSHLQQLPRPLYWSWRIVEFATNRGNLLCTPLLALWNYWPVNRRWAPEPSKEMPDPPACSAREAADLLEEGLWQQLETLFAVIRMSFDIGLAQPEFSGHDISPPAFYFAAPVSPPVHAEDYLSQDRQAIHTLVRTCLGSEDPASTEVAWGVMERDLVGLRKELATPSTYQSNYLLLPVGPTLPDLAEIEKDLEFVANSLTHMEFIMCDGARDLLTDVDSLGTRQALWGGTLDTASDLIGRALTFLHDLAPRHQSVFLQTLSDLQILLLSLQPAVERAASNTEQLARKLRGYIDGTEDFIRRNLTLTPVTGNVMNLRQALLDAYPYHYAQQPVASRQAQGSFLQTSLGTILDTLSEILREADRLKHETQEQRTQQMTIVLTLLALFIGLPQFLPGVALSESTYPNWLTPYCPLSVLEAICRFAIVPLMIVVLMLAAASFSGLVRRWFRPRRQPFWSHLRSFHRLAQQGMELASLAQRLRGSRVEDERQLIGRLQQGQDQRHLVTEELRRLIQGGSNDVYGELEVVDQSATTELIEIWKTLSTEVKRRRGRLRLTSPWVLPLEAQTWLREARRFLHQSQLFDLRPEVLPLPRALCVLRCRSTDFTSRSIVSDYEFWSSLRAAGLASEEISKLDRWLSYPDNRRRMERLDIQEFVELLKGQGVSADPQRRESGQW